MTALNDDQVDLLMRAVHRREVSPGAVAALKDLIGVLRRLDDEIGPEQLIAPVTTQLTVVTTLLTAASGSTAGFMGLSPVASELSQLAAWLWFDMNDTPRAIRHLIAAHRAAVAAADDALAAYPLGWRSIIEGQVDPERGLDLARAASRQAGTDPPPSLRAWILRATAEAHAGQGDRRATEQVLDQLAEAASAPRTERDPAWTYFIGQAQIAAYRGVCFVRMGGAGAYAEASLIQGLNALEPSYVRDRCLYLTYLAGAHVQQGHPDIAATIGTEAVTLAVATASPRSIQRVRRIRRDLEPWARLPQIQAMDDALRTG